MQWLIKETEELEEGEVKLELKNSQWVFCFWGWWTSCSAENGAPVKVM